MRRKSAGLILAFVALVAFVACDRMAPPPTAPTTIIITQNQNQNGQNQGGPNASPSPGSGGLVAAVTINGVAEGQRCPAGTQPATGQKEIRLTCVQFITVNPRRSDGSVIQDTNISGLSPEKFDALYGKDTVASFTIWDANSYNADLRCNTAGKIGLQATVKGVQSPVTEFTCVQ